MSTSDQERASDIEDEDAPLRTRLSNIPPGLGFGMDAAAAASRFGTALLPEQSTIQAVAARKLTKALQKLRDIDINDEWDETLHRVAHDIDGAVKEVRGQTLSLVNETAEDVLRRADFMADDLTDKYLMNHTKRSGKMKHYYNIVTDLMSRRTKKLQLMCLSFFIIFLIAWTLIMGAIQRPLHCSSHETSDHNDMVLKCYNVDDLLIDFQCSDYKCAVPTPEAPGDHRRCTPNECGCGGVCHYCTECLCTVGYGGDQYHVCKSFQFEGEELKNTVMWAITLFLVVIAALFGIRWMLLWYIDYRSSVVLYERERETDILKHARRRKQQKLRDEIVGTKVEFHSTPQTVYHPDLVKAAVMQRMEDRACYYKPYDERPATVGGELAQAALNVVTERIDDVREQVTRDINPALQEVYATRYATKSYSREKQRKRKLARKAGATLSSLKANLGDPWLKEVEQDSIPYSGQLYNIYHAVAEATSPTPENLVQAMFEEPGIHASLPFLRKFLLREPARNQLPLTWPEFYSEIALAKDFIHQVRRGGADFTKYLTSTTDNLWGDAPPKARPSQAAAILEVAKLLAPLFMEQNNTQSTTEMAAGVAPYAIPVLASRPCPTKNEAAAQKRALLIALKVLSGMMMEDPGDGSSEEESDCSSETDSTDDPLAYTCTMKAQSVRRPRV
eukprot:TRINITY_DN27488_c0_g1_i1.p1 TRINITY_DN27488_c0_g1~~TRINITY_DN27488_c0_g1_i1.p1  ORF type:complete len:675 (+),score=229.60 TRINITY_DN27488_c0_g1_i1:69-2093(+)